MRIAFRTDSSLQIGTGHLMRCLTLTEELVRCGHEVLFICRELEGNLNALVRDRGYGLELLSAPPTWGTAASNEDTLAHAPWLGVSQEVDAEQTAAVLDRVSGEKLDWLIVDHYALDERWEKHLRSRCERLMVIDDLADRRHHCDLLLDQNFYPEMETRYRGLVTAFCRTLLGPRYALLRPEFEQARRDLRTRNGEVRYILVLFGGVDADNLTMRATEALAYVASPRIEIDVVVGKSNPHQVQVRTYCDSRPKLRFHVQTERIAELMAKADLAVGGGGVATWERCALGLPALVAAQAYNQEAIAEAVAEAGAIRYIGISSLIQITTILDEMRLLLARPDLLIKMSLKALRLVDVKGTVRVAEALEERG